MREWKGDQVYRVDKAQSMHFRYTETAVAFEDARCPVPRYRCWSSLVPVAFSQGRVPLGPRGPKARHRSSLHFSTVSFHASNICNDRFFSRGFTSHYLAARTSLLQRTGCLMSLSSSTCSIPIVQESQIDRAGESRSVSKFENRYNNTDDRKYRKRKKGRGEKRKEKKREKEERNFSLFTILSKFE